MIWWDHVFNFLIISDEGDKFSKFCYLQSESIMRAIMENKISPDNVLYYIPWVSKILWKKLDFLEISKFGKFWKILEKLWVLISKVGGKLWRREGFMQRYELNCVYIVDILLTCSKLSNCWKNLPKSKVVISRPK